MYGFSPACLRTCFIIGLNLSRILHFGCGHVNILLDLDLCLPILSIGADADAISMTSTSPSSPSAVVLLSFIPGELELFDLSDAERGECATIAAAWSISTLIEVSVWFVAIVVSGSSTGGNVSIAHIALSVTGVWLSSSGASVASTVSASAAAASATASCSSQNSSVFVLSVDVDVSDKSHWQLASFVPCVVANSSSFKK